MLKTYLKSAFRNLRRNKLYTTVSALGLALGLAVCILALHYLIYESNYDRFKDSSRIYEVIHVQQLGSYISRGGYTPPGLATAMEDELPNIEASTAFLIRPCSIQLPGSGVVSENFCVGDSTLWNVFDIPFVEGKAPICLEDPNSVVITETLAQKCFRRTDPMGHTLLINGHECIVSGVIRNLPRTTSFSFDGVLSNRDRDFYPFTDNLSWRRLANILTFIKVYRGTDVRHLAAELPHFVKASGGSADEDKLELLPLRKVHFASYLSPLLSTYEVKYLYILSAIAILILAVSVFNFVGINITVFSRRVKEIGIRKVTGAGNKDLVVQFLVENIILTMASFLISICFAELGFRWFNSMLGMSYMSSLSIFNRGVMALLFSVLILDITISMYATKFFASARTNLLIQGETERFRVKEWVRQVLVAGQFAIAIFLISCTLVVISQMHFISHKDLGFNRHNLLLIDNVGSARQASILKNKLSENPDVLDVSEARWLLTRGVYLGVVLAFDAGKPPMTMHFEQVDQNFVPTLGLKLVKGRNFNPSFRSDSGAAIVNEAALRELNIKNPFSDTVRFAGQSFKIVGVVKDFNYSSLRNSVGPFVFIFAKADPPSLAVRIRQGKTSEVLRYLRANWRKINPDNNLNYSFLNDDLNKFYVNDNHMLDALLSGSLTAILIALMGVFALSSFLIETKTKEIAIRRVLGASVAGIVKLISSGFVKLVAVAVLIASPVAYYVMAKWLDGFAYRVRLDALTFLLIGLLVVLVALATMAVRSARAATAKPVESLRYE